MLLIGVGGAVGSAARFTLQATFPSPAGAWPWATFGINVVGAFALAVLLEVLVLSGPDEGVRRHLRLGLGTGLLGGFTTYSAFMAETLQLGDAHGYVMGLGYAAASVLLGFIAAYTGMAAVAAAHRRRAGSA